MKWNFLPLELRNEFIVLEPMRMELLEETCRSLIPDPEGWYSVMFGLNNSESYKKEFEDAEKLLREKGVWDLSSETLKQNR